MPLLGFAHIFHDPGFFGATIFGMIMLYAGVLSILTVRMLRFMRTNVDLTRSLDAKLGEITEMAAELEEARHEAVEANLSKSRFLAHASHDLRQPIHAIGLFTACLRDLDLDAEAQQHVRSIDNAARSVSRLLGSLLDISRLDVGGIELSPNASRSRSFCAASSGRTPTPRATAAARSRWKRQTSGWTRIPPSSPP